MRYKTSERGETKEVAEIYWVKNRSEGQKLDYVLSQITPLRIWPFRIYSFQFTSVTSSHCRLISIWVQFRQRHAYDIGFDRIGKGCRECRDRNYTFVASISDGSRQWGSFCFRLDLFPSCVRSFLTPARARSNRILARNWPTIGWPTPKHTRDNEIYYRPVSSASNYSPRFRAQEASNKRIRRLIFTLTGLCRRVA